MSENFYTSSTAALKATTADIRNLNAKNIKLNGKSIPSKVLDERGDFVTDQDLWGTSITTDENGVVHVSHKFLSNPNGLSAWNSSVKSVKDNKAYTSTDASGEPLCNIQTEMIKDGSNMFAGTSLTLFFSDLSSLVNGTSMFSGSSINSFRGDLSSLVDGSSMFEVALLTAYRGDLSSLVNGTSMFDGSSITSFMGDLRSLVNGTYMFTNTGLTTFRGALSSLANGDTMFASTSLTSFSADLSSLVNGYYMFEGSSLESFSGDLSSLVNGTSMFSSTSLTSFSGDLRSLIDGYCMFEGAPLTSFRGDLCSLVTGSTMFSNTALKSFSSDLSSLVDGDAMFYNTALKSFSSDLSSLVDGSSMFANTHKRGYKISHEKLIDGERTRVTEHVRAEGLTSFSADLSSLQIGYIMFGNGANVSYTNKEGVIETTKNITPLDEQSIMIIADTIKDLNGFTDWATTSTTRRGVIHIGYDSTVCDIAKIEEYCTEIMNKGWTVYLNGTVQTTDDGIEGIATTAEDGTVTVAPVPYYCKPVEVEQKEANWTDGEKYYIILGAQKVFGDDLSTYGMFTSIEDAAMNMGFTSYEYVEEETKTVEEN